MRKPINAGTDSGLTPLLFSIVSWSQSRVGYNSVKYCSTSSPQAAFMLWARTWDATPHTVLLHTRGPPESPAQIFVGLDNSKQMKGPSFLYMQPSSTGLAYASPCLRWRDFWLSSVLPQPAMEQFSLLFILSEMAMDVDKSHLKMSFKYLLKKVKVGKLALSCRLDKIRS